MKTGRTLVFSVALIMAASVGTAQEPAGRVDRSLPWVTDGVEAPGLEFRTFESTIVGAKVSFHIYAPPAYDRDQARLPVLYWLHGTAGGVNGVRPVAQIFADAMERGDVPPMLVVFVNGLPARLWCDSGDGASPVETVFIQELIPHIDKTFRTVAGREGRILEGFSMGGYGAGRIGMNHPELFAGISMLAGGPLDPEFRGPRAEQSPGQRQRILRMVCSGDLDYFRQQSPWTIAETMAAKGREQKAVIRVVVGDQDLSLEDNRKFHERLENLKIDHDFVELPDVGHDAKAVFAALDKKSGEFYRRALQSGDAPDECRYLLMQLFTYDPSQPGRFDPGKIENTIEEIVSTIGHKGDGKQRKLGFAVGPLCLDQTDQELSEIVRASFRLAVRHDVAVGFHIDDSMFWARREELCQDERHVEWTNWDGDQMKHRYVPWVGQPLAPQMCYNSPTLRKEIRRIAKDVLGTEIEKGVAGLREKGKESLFAGVIAGWETHLYDYRYSSKDKVVEALLSREGDHPSATGFHALHNLGFSQDKPPADFDQELENVVQDWIAFWAESLSEAGIPANRIYTHVMFPPARKYLPWEQITRDLPQEVTWSALIAHADPKTAFNRFSRPGFSTYPSGIRIGDDDALFATIDEALKSNSVTIGWASSEGTNVNIEATGITWDRYLGRMYGSGATMVNVFGWEEAGRGQYGKATRSPEGIESFRRFLQGKALTE